jgi:hypothetical protein
MDKREFAARVAALEPEFRPTTRNGVRAPIRIAPGTFRTSAFGDWFSVVIVITNRPPQAPPGKNAWLVKLVWGETNEESLVGLSSSRVDGEFDALRAANERLLVISEQRQLAQRYKRRPWMRVVDPIVARFRRALSALKRRLPSALQKRPQLPQIEERQ